MISYIILRNFLFKIDASNEYFKVTNNNKLTADNIDHIVDAFASRAETTRVKQLSRNISTQYYERHFATPQLSEAKKVPDKLEILKTPVMAEFLGFKLDELVRELCPNGVEYRQLKEILIIRNSCY